MKAIAAMALYAVIDMEDEYGVEVFSSPQRAQFWINAQIADDEELDADRFTIVEVSDANVDSALDETELADADQLTLDDCDNYSSNEVEEDELENA